MRLTIKEREESMATGKALDGRPVMDRKIRHADIVKGGELVFEMASLKTQKGTGLIGECVKWQN